ncbi:MAG: cytochrome P450 [Pseudonocardia sp.]
MSTTEGVRSDAPSYPFIPPAPLEPPTEFAELRDREPISRIEYAGGPAWLLTRYDDIRAAMTDSRLVPYLPGMPEGEEANDSGVLFLMSGPRHTRLRRLVTGALSARRVAALRPAVARLAAARLADLVASGPPVDLMAAYAAPLAIGTLSELMGVDIADRDGFVEWSSAITALFGESPSQDLMRSGQKLGAFITQLVASKRAAPGPDLISGLIEAEDRDGHPLTDAEVNGVAFSVLGAGYVPPAQALTLGMLRLLLDPAVATMLRTDPSMVPRTVDELLRLDPSGAGSADRALRATDDVEIGGGHIRAGDIVVAPLGAANRDPAVFPAPERFDPTRSENPHVSFAPGIHHCVGAALARMELEVAITTLLVGLPELTLAADVEELAWRTGTVGERNLVALPVTWRASMPRPEAVSHHPGPGTSWR